MGFLLLVQDNLKIRSFGKHRQEEAMPAEG
jgi:hypothetical protein